jgi:predicted dehydrogenase
MSDDAQAAGVIGVGRMGSAHARVYAELSDVELVGVADADAERAAATAAADDTAAVEAEAVLDRADVVSIAVPTRYHYPVAREAIDRGVDVLVEKPFVADVEEGRDLLGRASDAGVTLQVGHVERFNPAVRTLQDVVADLDVIALQARRLGPPIDRDLETGIVFDLMIHDIDVVCSLVGGDVASVTADAGRDDRYVDATLRFDNGVIASLTASRVTQQKVRELSVTARDCKVNVDYTDQSIEIHRHSLPEYVERDGDVRYRHESIIERPTVENGEPLKAELASFVEAAATDSAPDVTGRDGLRAIELAERIEAAVAEEPAEPMEASR